MSRYKNFEIRNLRLTTLLLCLFLAFAIPCFGQGDNKIGSAGLKFLEIDTNARSAAMGSASNSIMNDVSAVFLNPAGLAYVSKFGFSSSYINWIADIKQYAIAAAINLDNLGLGWLGGTLAASLLYTDNGDLIRTEFLSGLDDFVQQEEPYTIAQWAVGIAYAKRVTDRFSFGGHIKYVVQDLGSVEIFRDLEDDTLSVGNKVSPIVLDFGTIYNTGFHDLMISMSFRNFSQELIYVRDKFELPITMRIGAAINVPGLDTDAHSLTVAIDVLLPRDFDERINLGFEYWFLQSFAIRGGYKFNYDEEGFNAGIGIKRRGLKIDYAYTSFGLFESVQRFSFGFQL